MDGGAVETYRASGPESANASWSLSGDDAGDFDINGGMLTFRSSPDYENPMGHADRDNVYMVTIMADDGTYMDTHDVMGEGHQRGRAGGGDPGARGHPARQV